MAIPYPSSPTVGQTFTYGGITYTWNGVAWVYTQTATPAVVGSVQVTAPITNTGTPTAPVIGINQSALSITKSQVSDFTSGTVASASVAGTASYATTAGTSVNISGTIAQSQVTNLITDLAGKANLAGGNSFTGAQIIRTNGTANIGLVVQGTASQSANLQEWRTDTGSTAIRVASNGLLSTSLSPAFAGLQSTSGVGAYFAMNNDTGGIVTYTNGTANKGLVVRGASGQAADLLTLQNNSTTAVSGFDNASNLFVNNTYYGYNTITTAPASTTFWKIATLPISTGGTYDHLVIDAVLDDSWGSNQKVHARVILGNRNGFTYRYYLNGTVRTNCRILTYTEADGSVSVYFRVAASSYASFSYNLTHSIAGVTIFKNPASTTTTPTGTLSFDSGVIATYTPEFYIPYTGQPIIRGLVNSAGTVSGVSFVKSGGTSGQFLKADGSSDSNTYLATNTSSNLYGSSYFAGHNPEGRFMYNAYLANDMANARLRGSTVSATQNGVSYSISNANWDAMFDGTASFFNISPTSGFTFPLVMTISLPRTLTYGAWVGISFGGSTFRANSVQIEVFSLDSSSWVTVVNTTTNTSEDVFAAVSGLTNGNATGINQIRYTLSSPNSTQLRIQHLWAYNFNSDMWSQTMMPRAGGSFYGPVTNTTIAPASVPLIVKGASGQTANLQEWQNNSGGTVALVNSSGDVVTPNGAMFIGSGYLDAKLSINTQLATQKGIVVRAATSQTADLQQWQNSSGGTVSYIKADGSLYINSNSNTTGVYWKGTSSDQSIRANGNDLFVTPRFDLIYSPTDTTGRLRPGTDNAADLGTTGQRWKNLYATGAVLNSLSMSSTTSPILLNGSAGTSGQVLTSGGAGTTPTWTTVGGGGGSFTGGTLTSDLVLAAGSTAVEPLTFQANTSTVGTVSGAMEYDGTVFYQTSNTNPGKALATQNYYYVSNSDYGPDFTVNSTAKSLLGGSTIGLTVAAGTTYEYELITAISHQFVTTASISGDYLIVSTTVSGSPVVSTTHQVDYGSNTTGFTTATTLSTVRPTGNVTFMPAITSGTRYAFLRAKGLIRVTGTGTVKIYPAIQTSGASGSGDNIWNVRSGTIFKLTPVGNGTVTQVGAFA